MSGWWIASVACFTMSLLCAADARKGLWRAWFPAVCIWLMLGVVAI